MGKKIQRLPDSELDIMLALWNGHPEMTRMEIEDESLYSFDQTGDISAAREQECIGEVVWEFN